MRALVLLVILAVGAVAPATAQQMTPDTDKTLWCASAFYWLAGSAEDAGATEEAETYDRWSKRLLDVAGAALASSGFQPDRIEQLVTQYDEAALAQLGTEDSPFDIVTCPDLLGDWR